MKQGSRRRVRLVLLIRKLCIGGAERQLVALAKNLDQKLFDVTVLTLYDGGEFATDLAETGVRVRSLEKTDGWEVFAFFGGSCWNC